MNYTVRAFRIVSTNGRTTLEDYQKDVSNYVEAEKEMNRLRSLGDYTHIKTIKIKKSL